VLLAHSRHFLPSGVHQESRKPADHDWPASCKPTSMIEITQTNTAWIATPMEQTYYVCSIVFPFLSINWMGHKTITLQCHQTWLGNPGGL
jgi:hypothetical protein